MEPSFTAQINRPPTPSKALEDNCQKLRQTNPFALFKALVDAYEATKSSLIHMAIRVTIKIPRVVQMSLEPTAGADGGSKTHKKSDSQLSVEEVCKYRCLEAPATQEFETGPTFELMKALASSLTETEYFFQYSQGIVLLPFHHFINNDLEYLRGGVSSRKYSTSVTKTTAADYGAYQMDRMTYLYAFSDPQGESRSRRLFKKARFIVVTKVEIVEWQDYKHLMDNLCEGMMMFSLQFKEGDFHMTKDPRHEVYCFFRARKSDKSQVEEHLQLGVESYQKKLNLTKPDTYRSNLRRQDAYTPYSDPRGFIYENKEKKNRLMRIDMCTDKSKITRKQSKHGHENQKSAKPKPQKIQSLSQFSSTRTNLAIFESSL
ncbi:hypothetical protein Tco_0793033 [Tanacetum coccineum]